MFEDTKKFDKLLSEKGAHYLETNQVVYPNFKYSDDVVFLNQVFVTTGNVENIKMEFNKFFRPQNHERRKRSEA